MTASVMQALLGAGISPADASRISLAMDAAYGPPPASSTKQQYSGEARADAFALFSSSPSSQLVGSGPEYTGGPAALGVRGLAHFSGQIYASSTAYVGGLSVVGDAAVSMSVSAKKGTFSDGVSVPGGASITPEAMSVSAPLVASGGLVSKGGAQFSGSNLFDGPVTLAGPVNWGGERRPATVEVLSFASASGNVVRLGRQQISVLHDHGDASPGSLTFSLASLVATSVITKVGFDATACAVTASGTTVYHLGTASTAAISIAVS